MVRKKEKASARSADLVSANRAEAFFSAYASTLSVEEPNTTGFGQVS
jgi:hypothetical protein